MITSQYSLAIPKGGTTEKMFLNAIEESDEHQLAQNDKIVTYSEPLDKFIDIMVRNEQIASETILFHYREAAQTSKHYPCKLAQITGSNRKAPPGVMAFMKGWPWTELFNYHLLRMKESGLMERLYQINMIKRRRSCPHEYSINRIMKEPRPVGTDKTFSLYIALLIGFLSSLVFFLMEKLSLKQH